MSPLLYLQVRRIKNGILRSFKTPMRAAMTVFIGAYLLFSLFAMLQVNTPKTTHPHFVLTLHPEDAVPLFTLFHALVLFFVLPPPKYLFTILSETDVTNLYPLPLKRWHVFKFFLFTRSYLVYIFMVGVGALYASMALRVLVPGIVPTFDNGIDSLWTVIYVLFMIVVIAGLLFWRLLIDILREFNRIPANTFRYGAVLGVGTIVGVLFYRASLAIFSGKHPLEGLLASADSFPFTIVFAPFRILAEFLVRRADFSGAFAWAGMTFWTGLAFFGYRMLRRQEPILYEYAARLASFRTEMILRMRNPAAMLKRKAEQGRLQVQLPWFLHVMDPRRAGAIFWRDMIVSWRSYGIVIKWLANILLLAVVAGWFAVGHYRVLVAAERIWVIGSLVLLLPIAPLSMLSVSSVAEILRRSDIQKPLPIGGFQSIAMQILQWTAMMCSVLVLPYIAAAVLFHTYWDIILFLLVIGCSFSHTFVSAGFLIALFNPDQQDPVQRMYAALFGFFSMLGSSVPGALVLVVCFLLHLPLVPILALVLIVNGTMAVSLHYLSARKYANFVFTE